jgi:hypothetical protein
VQVYRASVTGLDDNIKQDLTDRGQAEALKGFANSNQGPNVCAIKLAPVRGKANWDEDCYDSLVGESELLVEELKDYQSCVQLYGLALNDDGSLMGLLLELCSGGDLQHELDSNFNAGLVPDETKVLRDLTMVCTALLIAVLYWL